MLLRILFWFIVFYSLFKLMIRFVLPLVIRGFVRSKLKDMGQRMGEFENRETDKNTGTPRFQQKDTAPTSQGDYIDFEEVK